MTHRTDREIERSRTSVEERTAGLERHLAAAQQITHIGSWEWDLASNRVTWSDELYRIYGLEPRSVEITFESFLAKLVPEDRKRVEGEVRTALEKGDRFSYHERIVRPDGMVRHLDTLGEVKRDPSGRPCGLIGTCRDITVEAQGRRLRDAEQHILEMIASGAPLKPVLTQIALMIEEQAPRALASILLLDERGKSIRTGAAPNLPPEFNLAIDGLPIGRAAGSCGAAAFLGKPVLVDDIATDERWTEYRDLAQRHGLRACWSTPIVGNEGRVLGTFALYYREPRSPQKDELELIARATHIAGIAIQRSHLADQLRALTAHIEAIREDERTKVSREIHDVLGQALTALKMDIAWLGRHGGRRADSASAFPPATPESVEDELRRTTKLAEMSALTDDLIDSVRRISADLRPGVLDDLGLGSAIEWQAQQFQSRSNTTCVVHSNLGTLQVDRELGTAVFRIFQEALTNVARHAKASHVDVRLEAKEGRLTLSVRDDGRGIPVGALAQPTSLGLLGVRERAWRLGGTVDIRSDEGAGTQLILDFPLRTRRSS